MVNLSDAFLNKHLKEVGYMTPPPISEMPNLENKIYKLKKSLHSLNKRPKFGTRE